MKWTVALQKKWIDLSLLPEDMDLNFCNKCIAMARNSSSFVVGFVVIETRDFGQEFWEKLAKRAARSEFSNCTFELVLPTFLKFKVDTLLASTPDLKISVHFSPFVNVVQRAKLCTSRNKIRVASVDDSPVLLKLLKKVFDSMGFVEVVGQFSDSVQAGPLLPKHNPDVITLDIQMPKKNGVQLLKEILAVEFFPILMISSVSLEEGSLVMEALGNGAFDYIQKPRLEDIEEFRVSLEEKLIAAIEGKNAQSALRKKKPNKARAVAPEDLVFQGNLVWCLGASTGGTQALTRVLTSLPHKIPPILIVQHIPPIYSKAFADSVNALVPFSVAEAKEGDELLPDHVYVAPGGMQMGIVKKQNRFFIVIEDSAPVNRFKPSVDFLFKSVAKFKELKIVAGIFTGMGKDGAKGLLELKNAGARTFAQSEESCTVFGMPRAALEIGAAELPVSLDEAAMTLLNMSSSRRNAA